MSMFQKRHYEAVARNLREAKAHAFVTINMDTLAAWELTVRVFTSQFKRDNPNFNPSRFYEAAGYEGVT